VNLAIDLQGLMTGKALTTGAILQSRDGKETALENAAWPFIGPASQIQ